MSTLVWNQDTSFDFAGYAIQGTNLTIRVINLPENANTQTWQWSSRQEPDFSVGVQNWNSGAIIQEDNGLGSESSVVFNPLWSNNEISTRYATVTVPLPLSATAYDVRKSFSFIFSIGGELEKIQVFYTVNDNTGSGSGALLKKANELTVGLEGSGADYIYNGTDVSVAINDAISDLDKEGGNIYIFAGQYKIINPVNLALKSNIKINGAGAKVTSITGDGLNTTYFNVSDSINRFNHKIQNLSIDNTSPVAGSTGLVLDKAKDCNFFNVVCQNFDIGVKLINDSLYNNFINVDTENCKKDIVFDVGTLPSNSNNFYGCKFLADKNLVNTTLGIHEPLALLDGNQNTFTACVFENFTRGVYVNDVGNAFTSNRVESNDITAPSVYVELGPEARNNQFISTYYSGNDWVSRAVSIVDNGQGNSFYEGGNFKDQFVDFTRNVLTPETVYKISRTGAGGSLPIIEANDTYTPSGSPINYRATTVRPTAKFIDGYLNEVETFRVTAQGQGYFASGIDVNNQKIINVATPTSDFDAATKKYVDDNAGSIGSFVTLDTAQTITGNKKITASQTEIEVSGDSGASTSVGGALLIDNTANLGAGLTLYSNLGATANGHLAQIRTNNTNFDRSGLFIDYSGTNHALTLLKRDTGGSNSTALNLDSNSPISPTGQAVGRQDSTGTLKVTHIKPATDDTLASGFFLEMQNASSNATGILVYSQSNGKLISLNSGTPSSSTEVANINNDGSASFQETNFNNQKIINVATPTNATDGANKDYVDQSFLGALSRNNNLSDLSNTATSRANLGLDFVKVGQEADCDYITDGVDDQVQINQALIDTANNFKTVLLSSPSYTISDFINFQDNTFLIGKIGYTVVNLADNSDVNMIRVNGVKDVYCAFLEFNGNKANQTVTNDITGAGIRTLGDCDNVYFEKIKVKDTIGDGFYFDSVNPESIIINECQTQGTNARGVHTACSNVKIIGGVYAETTDHDGVQFDFGANNCIALNVISHSNFSKGFECRGANNCKFINCVGYNNGTDGLLIEQADSCVVQGCHFHDNTNIGIIVAYGASTRTKGHKITNNKLENNGATTAVTNMVIGYADYLTITNNEAIGGARHGIDLQISNNCNVSNNVCLNNNRLASSVGSGIALHSSTRNVVTGNICLDNQATKRQAHGIRLDAGSSNNIVANNQLFDNLGTNLEDLGVGNIISNNITT